MYRDQHDEKFIGRSEGRVLSIKSHIVYCFTSFKARIPVGRPGVPGEIASIVEMIVKNAYMTNKVRFLSIWRLLYSIE